MEKSSWILAINITLISKWKHLNRNCMSLFHKKISHQNIHPVLSSLFKFFYAMEPRVNCPQSYNFLLLRERITCFPDWNQVCALERVRLLLLNHLVVQLCFLHSDRFLFPIMAWYCFQELWFLLLGPLFSLFIAQTQSSSSSNIQLKLFLEGRTFKPLFKKQNKNRELYGILYCHLANS